MRIDKQKLAVQELIADSKNENHKRDRRCSIACAVAAKTQRIITKDKDPMDSGSYQKIEVVSPEDCAAVTLQDAHSVIIRPTLCVGSRSPRERHSRTMIPRTGCDAFIHA
jgi:hypothetical protein